MTAPLPPWLCALTDDTASSLASCGGKAVGLHRLLRGGLPVPGGFCVTTRAFDELVRADASVQSALSGLAGLAADDTELLRERSGRVRDAILRCAVPPPFEAALLAAYAEHTGGGLVAVRSSATAEDLSDASFAGQQDSFLHVQGALALREALLACWASLFSERAVSYRARKGIAPGSVSMAVVVQRMVEAEVAGVLFTAEPLEGTRTRLVVEAVRGVGEALVSGKVVPERYIFDRRAKARVQGEGSLLDGPTLAALAELGARAEDLAGAPQDVEWALQGGALWLLQTRAITTLWPLPAEPGPALRVYVSFGHGQINTAALSRIGSSFFQHLIPFGREEPSGRSSLVHTLGERLYVEATPALVRKPLSEVLPRALEAASAVIGRRLQALRARPDFAERTRGEGANPAVLARTFGPLLGRALRTLTQDPLEVRDELVAVLRAQGERQRGRSASARTVTEKLDVLLEELRGEFQWLLLEGSLPRILPAMLLSGVLARVVPALVPGADAFTLQQGMDGSVTTAMDLALAELAERARPVPELVEALRAEDPVAALEALRGRPECEPFFLGLEAFLREHGHRSAGEIDPGVPRWREDPRLPLRSVAGALEGEPNALARQHAELRERALSLREALLEAAGRRPLGWLARSAVRRAVDRTRALLAVREEHKYVLIQTVAWAREVTLEAAAALHRAGVLESVEQVWRLELLELRDAVARVERGEPVDLRALLAAREALFARYAQRAPPAVVTSDGELVAPKENLTAEPGTLPGTAVSRGVYEGVARVVHDPAKETLARGEVLVARFTDPGWTPLFGHAGALVMEVGGTMTHGSVVARELGLPAVVEVEDATRKIESGMRVRVDGDRGCVTLLGRGAA